ncbi:MAG TPA: alpha/beta hydrolase [Nocardioidaceae bacterium]|nr:alpha/beta hydrolase [Nocardioidaceae bacterium]
MSSYDSFDVPVPGGDLRVGRWTAADPAAPVVVAAHGVTANHRTWALVAEQADFTLVAPDLRGRGRSGELEGRAGIARHADDLLAVLDHLAVDTAVVTGHSMGGFVAAAFAGRHPDRTAKVVLLDGGLPLPAPAPGTTPKEAVAATIGPAAQRLTMTFASVADYFGFWRPHPALADEWGPAVEDYLSYDLVGEPPALRSSVSLASLEDDSMDLLDQATVDGWARGVPRGTVFLRAGHGLLAEPGGLYPPDLVAEHARRYPHLDFRHLEEVNHYTLLLGSTGATTVAKLLSEVAR